MMTKDTNALGRIATNSISRSRGWSSVGWLKRSKKVLPTENLQATRKPTKQPQTTHTHQRSPARTPMRKPRSGAYFLIYFHQAGRKDINSRVARTPRGKTDASQPHKLIFLWLATKEKPAYPYKGGTRPPPRTKQHTTRCSVTEAHPAFFIICWPT